MNTQITTIPKWHLQAVQVGQSIATTMILYGQPYYAKRALDWNPSTIALAQIAVGVLTAIGSVLGGKVIERHGCRASLQLGLLGLIAGSLAGSVLPEGWNMVVAIALVAGFQGFIWPAIEAALTRGEPQHRVQHLVGMYNLGWSGASGFSFFITTPLMSVFGLRAMFVLPLMLYLLNLLIVWKALPDYDSIPDDHHTVVDPEGVELAPQQRHAFRLLGWLANPMAYVAINVIVTYNPLVAQRIGVSFATASSWFSLWFYVRMAAFDLLRRWSGWHYRPGMLFGAFGAAMLGFAGMILAPSLAVHLLAQVLFGLSIGLLYQSSLFYSMAGSEEKGTHGGFHESFIGLGIAVGASMAFVGDRLAPQQPMLSVGLVWGVMAAALLAMWRIASRVTRYGSSR
ncbi:MAG: MFS transporter [Armatimonadota bacterium]|nr:MFS transporter [Armatimonadota bacterium]